MYILALEKCIQNRSKPSCLRWVTIHTRILYIWYII